MPDHLPKARPTHLLASRRRAGTWRLCLRRVNRNGRLAAASLDLDLSAPLAKTDAGRISRDLRDQQLVHCGEVDALRAIAAAVPGGTPVHDIARAARGISFPSRVPDAPDLDDLAAMRRLPDAMREAAATCPRARLEILHDVWIHAILPSLSYLGSQRAISTGQHPEIRLAPHREEGFPLPAPDPVTQPMPEGGWRTDPWTPEEVLDCARRFAGGAGLEQLSDLTARSPRAVRARLIIDGFLIPD